MPDHGMDTPDGVSSSESQVTTENKKTCADCGTTKTPLWRGGPAGPKSLCNACGIRSRKKRRAVIGGLNKTSAEDKIKKPKKINNNSSSNHNADSKKFKDPLKRGLLPFGRSVLMQKKSSNDDRQRRNLGEVEQAAVLLMALSYGQVYA